MTLKHSAFLVQLLMEEVDLGESAPGGSNDHAVFSMRATDGPSGQVPGAKPSPNNMPVSWYDVRELQQVLWAKAEGIEQRIRLDLLKRTWKTSILSEEDDEEMTLPDPETPLVYSLHYAQERQDWEDELPPETVGRIKKQDKGKSNEIERQIQECIDAGLVEEYKHGDYPRHCSPCFLVAKPGSTAMRLVVDHGEVNKMTQNHSGSIPNMENTLERIAKCRFKTKMDKRSGFWQVDLTRAAQELLPFVTPKGRVFRWKVMPFGVANAPALFQELMNKILYILRRRPLVQELVSRGAEMEAHIDDVSLGTNTQEDHIEAVPRTYAPWPGGL